MNSYPKTIVAFRSQNIVDILVRHILRNVFFHKKWKTWKTLIGSIRHTFLPLLYDDLLVNQLAVCKM